MARHNIRNGVLIVTSDKMPAPTPITAKPKVSLYTCLKPESKCVFSEHAGKPALEHILPDRGTPLKWSPQRVQAVAAEIRNRQPDTVEGMLFPRYWEDLHKYFHPIDLWVQGASNLLEVVSRLLDENEICMWVERWLTWQENRDKLGWWDTNKDITSVFDGSDWANIHSDGLVVPKSCIDFLRGQLKYWYSYYRNLPSEEYYYSPPDGLAVNSPTTVVTISPADAPQLTSQRKSFDCLSRDKAI